METKTKLILQFKKLKDSQPVISTGMEYKGYYELNNKSAEKYLRENMRGNYINKDTGDIIKITRKGAEKVTRHDAENEAHLKSFVLIPKQKPCYPCYNVGEMLPFIITPNLQLFSSEIPMYRAFASSWRLF